MSKPKRNKASQRGTVSALRMNAAVKHREDGMSYAEIAKELKVDKSTAIRAVRRGLDLLASDTRESAERVVGLELSRLDTLWAKMYAQAKDGNQTAVDRCLRIMERRARLLGIDSQKPDDDAVRTAAIAGAAAGAAAADARARDLTPEEALARYEQLCRKQV